MVIAQPDHYRPSEEQTIYESLLSLEDAVIVELGCGGAQHTRQIAERHPDSQIHAFEVDQIQHQQNLTITDLPNVTFQLAGAESIPMADGSTDVVMMFKSLHHVPLGNMDQAFSGIARILKPGGYAYISEPVFAGDFNEILRMFHNEESVRQAAFAATSRAVASTQFELASETFFDAPNAFASFSEFEQKVIGVTHTEHNIAPELLERVREMFEIHNGPTGALFEMPIRVDLLRRI
ncbi:class I SAM-dependent methyltransferase [Candidatus Reidiella endopervernicosa]|nr:class I SAM-dependent methyltransferase [Solemya pervernicosa gill symbiont]QKQ28297.1 class I SAM-dependent methyltransferase [Candidatus Reidiella endopervernicosa]